MHRSMHMYAVDIMHALLCMYCAGVLTMMLHAAAARSAAAAPKLSLPAAARPGFEDGAAIIFRRWTALQLAVDQAGIPDRLIGPRPLCANNSLSSRSGIDSRSDCTRMKLRPVACQCAARCLQGWGGPDSAAKAHAMIRDVLGWFYNNTGRPSWYPAQQGAIEQQSDVTEQAEDLQHCICTQHTNSGLRRALCR